MSVLKGVIIAHISVRTLWDPIPASVILVSTSELMDTLVKVHMYVRTYMCTYRVCFKFCGVKLSWFLRISSHLRKFHPMKFRPDGQRLCDYVTNCKNKNAKIGNPRKFNPRKLKRMRYIRILYMCMCVVCIQELVYVHTSHAFVYT